MGSEASEDTASYILPDEPPGRPPPATATPIDTGMVGLPLRQPSEGGFARRLRNLEDENVALRSENNVLKQKTDYLYEWKEKIEDWIFREFGVQFDTEPDSNENPATAAPNVAGTSSPSIKTEDFYPSSSLRIVDVRGAESVEEEEGTGTVDITIPLGSPGVFPKDEPDARAVIQPGITRTLQPEQNVPSTSAGFASGPSSSHIVSSAQMPSAPRPPKKRQHDTDPLHLPKSIRSTESSISTSLISTTSSNERHQELQLIEVDEDAPCSVCNEKCAEEKNEMIFCEKCNLCVHQACYGVNVIPSGDWFCKPCSLELEEFPDCIFCPINGGAMVPVGPPFETYWAHVSCSVWLPEVRFEMKDGKDVDKVIKADQIDPKRWKMTCSLCNIKGNGACIECSWRRCRVAFHVTCALTHPSTKMEWIDDEKHPNGVALKVYCEKHKHFSRQVGQND